MAKESLSHRARVAFYARVSTLNHNQDPELQLRELRQYATARGWDVAGEYVDRGISGSVAAVSHPRSHSTSAVPNLVPFLRLTVTGRLGDVFRWITTEP